MIKQDIYIYIISRNPFITGTSTEIWWKKDRQYYACNSVIDNLILKINLKFRLAKNILDSKNMFLNFAKILGIY